MQITLNNLKEYLYDELFTEKIKVIKTFLKIFGCEKIAIIAEKTMHPRLVFTVDGVLKSILFKIEKPTIVLLDEIKKELGYVD